MGKKQTQKRARTKHNKSKRHRGGKLGTPPVYRPCNPKVILNKTTATQDTCLTNNLLKKLIDIHNELYPNSKINRQIPPQEVLRILREKSKECMKSTHTDKCMLQKAGLQSHSKEIFAPHDGFIHPKLLVRVIDTPLQDAFPARS